jgi:trigger factor
VRRGKALASVVQAATITGPDGEEVDLSELFGPATPEDEEAAAEIADETATAASGEDEAGDDAADAVAADQEATASASSAPQA